jgi:atypical dual specificity phosphatase
MQARTWWIDEPLVMATSNPSDEDLAELHSQGFSVVFSFLDEQKQPPKYDKQSAVAAGWTMYSFPIGEGGVPSFDQLAEFITCVKALPRQVKILMHCESGLGRTAFMAAAYWIANGLTAEQAIARVRQAASDDGWKTPQRESVLRRYAQLQESAGAT